MVEIMPASATEKSSDFTAADYIMVAIEDGRLTVLVGRSGCATYVRTESFQAEILGPV